MGRASRIKKERGRKQAQAWEPAAAARDAFRNRAATIRFLEDNPYAAAYYAAGTDRVFQEAMRQHIRLGEPAPGTCRVGQISDARASLMLPAPACTRHHSAACTVGEFMAAYHTHRDPSRDDL